MSITLTEVVAVGGLVSGVAGCVLGVLNYLRDRVKVQVLLQWDMSVPPGPLDKWAVIQVQNVGRRPVFISHVAIHIPPGYDHDHIVAMDSIYGEKLAEGDGPKRYPIAQDGMELYAKDWRKLRGQVSDATGRIWKAPCTPKKRRPSWATPKSPKSG